MKLAPGVLMAALLGQQPGLAQTWQPAAANITPQPRFSNAPSPVQSEQLQWHPADAEGPASSELPAPRLLGWEAVAPGEEILPETAEQVPAPLDATAVAIKALPSGPTYANFRALWRDGDWLPQISSLVPVGFGPQGWMLSLYARGIDCNTGKGQCPGFTTYQAWQDSLDTLASGQVDQVIGFGDPIKAFSVVLSNSSENLASQIKNGSFDSSTLTRGNQTGVHLIKAFGPDTSVRTGIDNLIRWDSDNDFYDPLSFYAVASQRIRINDNRSPWLQSIYITAGIGNGDFRPIEQIFQAQTAALKQAGCATYGYTPKKPCSQGTFNRAIQTGSNYGQVNAIGSLGLEVYNGINLITEWTGRNLNAGISWRPFPELGLVITPMLQSLIQNCEYPGCRVALPDYPERAPLPNSVLTQRARLSIQASIELKF